MTNSADGYDANLAALRDAADALLSDEVDDKAALISYFDQLPVSIQTKALSVLRASPHLTTIELYEQTQRRLALDEAAIARKWWAKLRVVPR